MCLFAKDLLLQIIVKKKDFKKKKKEKRNIYCYIKKFSAIAWLCVFYYNLIYTMKVYIINVKY